MHVHNRLRIDYERGRYTKLCTGSSTDTGAFLVEGFGDDAYSAAELALLKQMSFDSDTLSYPDEPHVVRFIAIAIDKWLANEARANHLRGHHYSR